MIFKTGDVVWWTKLKRKCVIDNVLKDHYDISFIKETNKGTPDQYIEVKSFRVKVGDVSQYLIHCPVCGKNNRILNGLVDSHPKDGPLCYGSYLPLR